jgi:SAM-dependent methyltransferase
VTDEPRDLTATMPSVQAAYDAVASEYDAAIGHELDAKPLDRALLTAFVELAGAGTIADVGCGPGHVTRFLAARHDDVVGIDLSPSMIATARRQAPGLSFAVGSMLALPVPDAAWAGAVALYSIIHLDEAGRVAAAREFARVVRPGGWLLLAFHIDDTDIVAGEGRHFASWFGHDVDLTFFFLDPAAVSADLAAAGFRIMATTIREPGPGPEHPSRRGYVLAQRPT